MSPAIQNEAVAVVTKHRKLVGLWKNLPSEKAVVLFSDATANRDDLAELLGRPVVDVTRRLRRKRDRPAPTLLPCASA